MSNVYSRYALTAENSAHAIEQGLAEADWYTAPVPQEELRRLRERRNGPALRDTAILVALLLATGYATIALWGTWWSLIPYLIYAVLYGTSSDSRWHETSHGTAFKSDWMNIALYEVASFMVMRESIVWRWSHNRHHSDTIIVGRDPEIQVPRPPDMRALCLGLFAIGVYRTYFPSLIRHALGRITEAERTFIPASEFQKVYRNARICVVIYTVVIASAVSLQSWIPLFLFVAPQFFGTWLMMVHNTPQHAGLAENVLDHRLNCRTVYMNPISRFIYWNMNYHVEHHMFPLVPYHALPKLHAAVKDDCPPPYPSILAAWREIIPALRRQSKEPGYFVQRKLPAPVRRKAAPILTTTATAAANGWIEVCAAACLGQEDVIRFDHAKKTYALYQTADGQFYATDGICTHGNTHLASGLVKGRIIECAKHNGRFDITDGSPQRAPICVGLRTYPLENRNGKLFLNISAAGGPGARTQQTWRFRVVSNNNVATFIKELVLEPLHSDGKPTFVPGDYLQLDIPAYDEIKFRSFDIKPPFSTAWERDHVFDYAAKNPVASRRNFSFASNPAMEPQLRFNIRISTPPRGQEVPAGAGSSYVFNLKPGDTVTAIGPFGDFHIKPTQKEMVYIGGGAGMAPLRAHLTHLFETLKTARKVSFWYGARSRQELFYQTYFEGLAKVHPNFHFHLALSDPQPDDQWTSHTGYIHEVVRREFLHKHPNINAVEFYLCGPPAMIKACLAMLAALGVAADQIAYDEF